VDCNYHIRWVWLDHNVIFQAYQVFVMGILVTERRAGLVQAVESYRLWPEGPGFESRSPRIAQARVRLATDTLPQTPHRAGALCTEYAPFFILVTERKTRSFLVIDLCFRLGHLVFILDCSQKSWVKRLIFVNHHLEADGFHFQLGQFGIWFTSCMKMWSEEVATFVKL